MNQKKRKLTSQGVYNMLALTPSSAFKELLDFRGLTHYNLTYNTEFASCTIKVRPDKFNFSKHGFCFKYLGSVGRKKSKKKIDSTIIE